jgi:hypothetical protein
MSLALLCGCGLACADPATVNEDSDTSDTRGDTVGDTDGDTDGDTSGDGDGDTSGDGDGDTLGAEYVFDQEALRTYELEIAPADLAVLDDDPLAEAYVPAILHFEGQTIGPIGVRYKGSKGSLEWCLDGQGNPHCPKLPMKLKFSEYDPDLRFYGLKRLNFHSMAGVPLSGMGPYGDTSKLHERLGYALFNEFGVPTARCVHARLLVNGELVGLFALVEQIDGRFTNDRFNEGTGEGVEDGDGNLYKEVWPVWADEQHYLSALKTNQDLNPSVAKMLAFADAIINSGDTGFNAAIETWMDVDSLMRYIAVDRTIEHWDGIVGFYSLPGYNHNYYWYEHSATDRVQLIPWDLDHTFDFPTFATTYGAPKWNEDPGNCIPFAVFFGIVRFPAQCDVFMRGIATQSRDAWLPIAQEFLDTSFSQEVLDARIDGWVEQIAPAVEEDPDLQLGQWQDDVDEFRADLAELRAAMQAEIDAG